MCESESEIVSEIVSLTERERERERKRESERARKGVREMHLQEVMGVGVSTQG